MELMALIKDGGAACYSQRRGNAQRNTEEERTLEERLGSRNSLSPSTHWPQLHNPRCDTIASSLLANHLIDIGVDTIVVTKIRNLITSIDLPLLVRSIRPICGDRYGGVLRSQAREGIQA